MKKKIYNIYLIIILFSYNCSSNASSAISQEESNSIKMQNNKVKVNVEQQKNKIIELENLILELNLKVEYQESMINTISEELKDQMEVVNKYDSSNSDLTKTLIRMKNKFEVLEDRAFYTDSVYFEIINDLVQIDSKIETLSGDFIDVDKEISDQQYSNIYYSALDSFIHKSSFDISLAEFRKLINFNKNNSLADNCQYWIGEIYYKQKLFKDSIVEFKKEFDFEKSNKLDDAQYKIILCYINLKNTDKALEEINNLKNNHPDSEYILKTDNLINKLN